ncbi:MAG TPA: hypothetical protein VHC18_08645, partial [Amycolatopsis sp.]|nr:hypothetical protein [Amycolatopsis sp.]
VGGQPRAPVSEHEELTRVAVDGLLARWESFRQAGDPATADRRFHDWLFGEALEQASRPETYVDPETYAGTVFACADRCGQLARYADGVALLRWTGEHFVPRGDDLACRVLQSTAEGLLHFARDADLRSSALAAISAMIGAAPRGAGVRMDRTICQAMMLRAVITSVIVNRDDRQVREYVAAWRAVVSEWDGHGDPEVRAMVAESLCCQASGLLQLDREQAARRAFAEVLRRYGSPPGENPGLDKHVTIAEHAPGMLDAVRIPGPELKTEYLAAQRRQDRRRLRRNPIQWIQAGMPRNQMPRVLRMARWQHRMSAGMVRSWACQGTPFVLVLRNFDLTETSGVVAEPDVLSDEYMPETFFQHIRSATAEPVLAELAQRTHLVHVANTQSGELEMGDMLRYRPQNRLYLPDATWFDTVRVLVALAEQVVVWAAEKTEPLTRELALLSDTGRAEDTVVLLEKYEPADAVIDYVTRTRRPPGRPLTPDDPALAGFPVVLPAAEAGSDLVAGMVELLAAAREQPTRSRIDRTRQRLADVNRSHR